MQFHASRVVSALILLYMTVCLAMQRSIGYDPYQIVVASTTCQNRVYSKLQLSFAILGGLRSIGLLEESKMKLDAVQYTPQPTEVMPSNEKFYFSELQISRRNEPTDLVVFSRNGLFAKVVTRVQDSQGFKYIDCVPSETTQSPQELQSMWGLPVQSSGLLDPLGIGITSASCEGRVYNKRQISRAITSGMLNIAKLNQLQRNPDVMQYKPKPTEAMPSSQDKFYFSELKNLGPNGPVDMVIFSSGWQFAKVVMLKQDGDDPVYIDCVPSPIRQSSERSPPRMGSPERLQLNMGPSKRRRLRTKSPEHESFV